MGYSWFPDRYDLVDTFPDQCFLLLHWLGQSTLIMVLNSGITWPMFDMWAAVPPVKKTTSIA
jgi:hypothetical protein